MNIEDTITFPNGMTIPRPKVFDPKKRTDVWVEAFDGIYRLALPMAQIAELERQCGDIDKVGSPLPRSLFAIARNLEGNTKLTSASYRECLTTVALGLVGGGVGAVDGKRVAVGPETAARLVTKHLENEPLEVARGLAQKLLRAVIYGRAATPAECEANRKGPPWQVLFPDGAIKSTGEGAAA